jgi:putative multiple sugar transport system permease protein
VVWQEVRDRRRQQEFSLDVAPTKLFLLKLVAIVAAILSGSRCCSPATTARRSS